MRHETLYTWQYSARYCNYLFVWRKINQGLSRKKREQSGARVIRDCIKQRHIFYPEKISIVRARARVIRDHNRISKYDPQQIKHQIVEGNISVDGQCSHYTLFISCNIISTGIHPCFLVCPYIPTCCTHLAGDSRGLKSLIRVSYWLIWFVVFCPRQNISISGEIS